MPYTLLKRGLLLCPCDSARLLEKEKKRKNTTLDAKNTNFTAVSGPVRKQNVDLGRQADIGEELWDLAQGRRQFGRNPGPDLHCLWLQGHLAGTGRTCKAFWLFFVLAV